MRHAVQPVYEERELDAFIKKCGANKCPNCARIPASLKFHWHHHTFSTRGNLQKHMRDLKFHNPWLDLVVEMATEDPSVFVCPSGDYESGSVEDVYKHCVSSQCKCAA